MSETKDESKWSLMQESENVNNITEFSESKEYWRYKTKSWPKQPLNLLPELLSDMARICRENTTLTNEELWIWEKTVQIIDTEWWDLATHLPVQKVIVEVYQ